ncbi:flagellar biosynthesis protein FlgJ [Paracidovorax anthurii]|uniref:Flagellar protein FlgJ n=1 Tax=Paracidovorax anthurii TaxID=78229 RepID=A0A328YS74_9BURK|nr:flagellar biosynthesis protein FlgJ [Paracidovorax anthurii]RAR76828.1 flagellar protein FlgJ [Paracidovorax anthurii]WCM93776.1 flagellar biosynthesis protein FlgJ [Acidovorax sp. NCPPB 2350]
MTTPLNPASAAAAASSGPGEDAVLRARTEEAARKFEAFFIAEALRGMRRSTREMASEDSIYRNRVNEDMLDMADTLVADALAGQRAFGIADVILRQLLPAQAAAAPAAPGPLKPDGDPVALPG